MNNKYYYDNDNNKIKIDNSAEFNVEILKKSETLKVDKVMNKTAKEMFKIEDATSSKYKGFD